jgi:hypothetical protein
MLLKFEGPDGPCDIIDGAPTAAAHAAAAHTTTVGAHTAAESFGQGVICPRRQSDGGSASTSLIIGPAAPRPFQSAPFSSSKAKQLG